jgi:hypothetical protein
MLRKGSEGGGTDGARVAVGGKDGAMVVVGEGMGIAAADASVAGNVSDGAGVNEGVEVGPVDVQPARRNNKTIGKRKKPLVFNERSGGPG